MPPSITLALGLIVIATAVLAIARRVDVRLVMFLAALAMGSVAGNPLAVLRTFFATFSSEKFIVPICSAMGFAYVLRHTGCDQHLVQMLVKPLRRVRPLLIPGAVCVGFVVNASVISQARRTRAGTRLGRPVSWSQLHQTCTLGRRAICHSTRRMAGTRQERV